MSKTGTPAVGVDVINYLTPGIDVKEAGPISFVWGEGAQNSPYDLSHYHAGHLAMLCIVKAIQEQGGSVNIALTSDHQARVAHSVFGQFYERRKADFKDWLTALCPGVKLIDVAEDYSRILANDACRKNWTQASAVFDQTCNHIEEVIPLFNDSEKADWENWANKLELARVKDNDDDWRLAMGACPNIHGIRDIFQQMGNIAYPNQMDDLAAAAFVIMRIFKDNRKKWDPNKLRNWINEVGTVLCSKFGSGIVMESARNMYWLRCLRLLSKQLTGNYFPNLVCVRNLPNSDNVGAMMGSAPENCVPIFASPAEVYKTLLTADQSWLWTFAELLCFAKDNKIVRELVSVFTKLDRSDKKDANVLRNAVLETIISLTTSVKRLPTDSVHVDDWFCLSYLSEKAAKLTVEKRWQHNLIPAHVADATYGEAAEWLTNEILAGISERYNTSPEKMLVSAVQRTVQYTDSIDLISHMTAKRYRDHGRHQLTVAAMSHLLWNASAPTNDYTAAESVATVAANKAGDSWSPERITDMTTLAALAHDHGYALQHVAWLLGRLRTMSGSGPKGDGLATALREHVEPFASTWFKSHICQRIMDSPDDPCAAISPQKWDAKYKGRFDLLLPENKSAEWPGHGIFSAMNLWGLMDDLLEQPIEKRDMGKAFDVLRAIAVHDVSKISLNITLEPVSYMLAVCDEIQEWSRWMFNDGRAVSESSCVELRGLNRAGLYGIQLNDDELRVRFIHLGVSATRVPWEYGIFREGKRTSLGRLTSADRVFPKSVTFEMAIGPEKP